MASRNLGSLTIDLMLKSGAFDRGLDKTGRKLDKTERDVRRKSKQMQRSMDQAFSKIKFAGVAAFGAISIAVSRSVASMDQLGDVSAQLGITTEGLSELQYVAEMSGSSANNLSQGLQVLSKRLGEVATKGTGAAANAIEALGLDAKELARLNPEEQFKAIRKAFQGLESQSQKNAVAAHLFSRANQNLVNTLGLTDDQVKNLRQDARDLGISISQNQVDTAGDAVDAMNKLKFSMEGLSNTLVSELAPVFTDAADSISDFVKAASKSGVIDDFASAVGGLANNLDILVGFFAGRFIAIRIGNFFATIVMGAKDATTAIAVLRAIMATLGGPIGIAATAVPGLAVAVHKLSGRQSTLEKSTDKVREAIERLRTTRGDAHKDAIQAAKDARDAAQANITEARSIIQKWEAAKKTAKATSNLGAGGGRLGAVGAQGSQALADKQIANKSKQIELLRGDLNELQRELAKPTVPAASQVASRSAIDIASDKIKQAKEQLKSWKETNKDVIDSIIDDQRGAVAAYDNVKSSIQSVTQALMTQDERAVSDNDARLQAINDAEQAGVQTSIGYDQLRARSWEQMTKDMNSNTDQMSDYAHRAAENIQDSFANFLFDPFKGGVSGMLDSFITMLRKMAAEMLASKAMDWIKTAFQGMGGWAGVGSAIASIFHTGGIVGSGEGGGRVISGATFSGAKRFHSGGMIGPGEVPAILKKGEGVFTKEQMSQLSPAKGGNQTIVNVNNAPEGTTVRRRKEGQQEIIDVMIDDVSNGGRFYKALSGMTNVGRAGR